MREGVTAGRCPSPGACEHDARTFPPTRRFPDAAAHREGRSSRRSAVRGDDRHRCGGGRHTRGDPVPERRRGDDGRDPPGQPHRAAGGRGGPPRPGCGSHPGRRTVGTPPRWEALRRSRSPAPPARAPTHREPPPATGGYQPIDPMRTYLRRRTPFCTPVAVRCCVRTAHVRHPQYRRGARLRHLGAASTAATRPPFRSAPARFSAGGGRPGRTGRAGSPVRCPGRSAGLP